MCDVLTEEWPAGLGARVDLAVAAVTEPARRSYLMQKLLADGTGGRLEHAAVAAPFTGRRIDALGRQAVIVQMSDGGAVDSGAPEVRVVFLVAGPSSEVGRAR
jgi:hypothetical protein